MVPAIFNFNDAPVNTFTHDDGSPWFLAGDVCKICGLANVGKALMRLRDKEKNTITISNGNRGNPNRAIISESGLYKLVLLSRKPEAEAFQDWVTEEVLPALRKTGRYEVQPLTEIEILQRSVSCIADLDKRTARLEGRANYEENQAKTVERIQALEWKNRKGLEEKVTRLESENVEMRARLESFTGSEGYLTVASYLAWRKIRASNREKQEIGVRASELCRIRGIKKRTVDSPLYPQGVGSYPKAILQEVVKELHGL